jgi:hypothetical protein
VIQILARNYELSNVRDSRNGPNTLPSALPATQMISSVKVNTLVARMALSLKTGIAVALAMDATGSVFTGSVIVNFDRRKISFLPSPQQLPGR